MSSILYKGAAYTRLKFSDDPRHDPNSPEFNYDEPPPPTVETVDEDWLGDDLPPDWYEKATAKGAIVYQGAVYEPAGQYEPAAPVDEPAAPATQPATGGPVLLDEELFGFQNLAEWQFIEDTRASHVLPGATAYSYWQPLAQASDGIFVVGVLQRTVGDVLMQIKVEATFADERDEEDIAARMKCEEFTTTLLAPLDAKLQFPDGSIQVLDEETANNFVHDAIDEEVIRDKIISDDLSSDYFRANKSFSQHSPGAWKIQ